MIEPKQASFINPMILFNDSYIALATLLDVIYPAFPKIKLKTVVSSQPSYPNFNLEDVLGIMDKIDVEPKINHVKISNLKIYDFPGIGHIKNDSGGGVFICILKYENGRLTYVDPKTQLIKTDHLQYFENKWSNLWLTVNIGANLAQNTAEYIQKEKVLKEDYRSSILEVKKFITRQECINIIRFCEEKNLFNKSKIDTRNGSDISEKRTSHSAFLNFDDSVDLRNLEEKICLWLGLSSQLFERPQCVKYFAGNSFGLHYDRNSSNRRTKTVLIYLNEDFTGGETIFPEIDFNIKPETGKAIVFTNIKNNGDTEIYSVHTGSPVTTGIKYALNIWISADEKINTL